MGRGTDSHSIYNWAENMRYWSTDFDVPFPGSDGAKVHTGKAPPALQALTSQWTAPTSNSLAAIRLLFGSSQG